MGFFSQLKESLGGTFSTEVLEEPEELVDDYVELAPESFGKNNEKVQVRPFIIEDFEGVRDILDSLRVGNTIALINIKPLKDKDIVELKRAINKIKKTCDAIGGDVAGFGDDWICVTPAFANIYRTQKTEKLD
ncbi:cell division protein SepF [Candidatus Woesearchaeota archaeon]|nr:cell division protein SepF [Candidatus Woesearchaeota archaeon]